MFMFLLNPTQLNEHIRTQALNLNVRFTSHISCTNLSPSPVRSKSYSTSWCIQNLFKRSLKYGCMSRTFMFAQTLQPRLSRRCFGDVSLCSGDHNSININSIASAAIPNIVTMRAGLSIGGSQRGMERQEGKGWSETVGIKEHFNTVL